MKILAPAKINLCLDILGKDPSGYHKVRTVLHEIKSIADELEFFESKEKDNTSIEMAHWANFPNRLIKMEENLAHKALLLIKSRYKVKKFAQIKIKKNIPISSGLGGASSDAAAVLKGLNNLWNLKLSREELLKLAEKLGTDVPFFIIGGTALGSHFGEKIEPLGPIKELKFEINEKFSPNPTKTKDAYNSLDLSKCGKDQDKTKKLLEGVKNGDNQLIIENLHNDFETIASIKKHEHLSGSGPSTFRIKTGKKT